MRERDERERSQRENRERERERDSLGGRDTGGGVGNQIKRERPT